ncbi:Asp-tRNA(Asn)/Glu-tRNA(Gln) amidotransferase subunit GatA [Candidatus Woesearchaeota archaeon]|nr:Asp-tRNA(Asn)/Glu-tRNA(Gln) amidotransferase subunit GatA [Candidatus Woesearchaeota archaeon]
MKVKDFTKEVRSGNIDIIEHTQKIIEEAKKINKDYNYFNVISEELALQQAKKLKEKIKKDNKGKLLGVPISVKDCICVKDIETTSGSRILKGYKPLFNATVIQKVIDEGGIIIGKTSQDEFGFGGFNTNVGLDYKIPRNPIDKERVTGGSSGGAAGFTKITKYAHLALAESTGGSIVNPASFCGVVGLCPTYGLVSRYGLIDYANSLDKIGGIAKNVEDVDLLLDVIKGHDENDSTSLDKELNKYKDIKKIGIIKEAFNVDDEIKDKIIARIDELGVKYEYISMPISVEYGIPTYYLIAPSEASTNLAKYCGMRYGIHGELNETYNEYFAKVRSNNFGKEAKRRIMIGTFARMAGYRDAYYLKAMKVRTLIINEYQKAFKKFDLLLSPTIPITAPKIKDIDKLSIIENYMIDMLTVGPNLAGLPHISVNVGNNKENMPIGAMFIGNYLDEKKLIEVGKRISLN